MVVMSASAFADQLVFSQYDGVNSWDNVYIEVQDAKIYPGGFIDGVSGSSNKGSAGSEWKPETFGYVAPAGFGIVVSEVEVQGTRTSDGATYTRIATQDGIQFDVDAGFISNEFADSQYRFNEVDSFGALISWEEGQEEVAAKPATREDPQVRRTIVSVPTGVDMQEFISNFMSKH